MEEAHGVNLNADRDQGENKVTVLGVSAEQGAAPGADGSGREARAGAGKQRLPERALSI